MHRTKDILWWLLIIVVGVLLLALPAMLSQRLTRTRISPVKGNPEIPPVSEEAERMEKMFRKLLYEKNNPYSRDSGETR